MSNAQRQTKVCSKCKVEKPVSEFYMRGYYWQSWCKQCVNARKKEKYQAHPKPKKTKTRYEELTEIRRNKDKLPEEYKNKRSDGSNVVKYIMYRGGWPCGIYCSKAELAKQEGLTMQYTHVLTSGVYHYWYDTCHEEGPNSLLIQKVVVE